MTVVDASAILEVLLNAPASGAFVRRLFRRGESLHTPHLLDLEVAQVLRRYCLSGRISADRGERALQALADLPLTRYAHDELLPRIWQLRHNITAYDAAYVALAEVLSAPLVTRDAALASASGHSAKIELL